MGLTGQQKLIAKDRQAVDCRRDDVAVSVQAGDPVVPKRLPDSVDNLDVLEVLSLYRFQGSLLRDDFLMFSC